MRHLKIFINFITGLWIAALICAFLAVALTLMLVVQGDITDFFRVIPVRFRHVVSEIHNLGSDFWKQLKGEVE